MNLYHSVNLYHSDSFSYNLICKDAGILCGHSFNYQPALVISLKCGTLAYAKTPTNRQKQYDKTVMSLTGKLCFSTTDIWNQ